MLAHLSDTTVAPPECHGGVAMTAPLTMFIGSSAEAKDVAEYLQAALQGHCEADVWDQHIFEPTGEVLGRLLVAAEGYDFATLVLSADDVVERRGVSAL